jgi:hypothetical protein
MFCSYNVTLPDALKVYLTSTCCCILPVLRTKTSQSMVKRAELDGGDEELDAEKTFANNHQVKG